jgi:N-acetylneuraminate synthase
VSAPFISIAGRAIGVDHTPYVIAELSANHMGKIERALELIEIAAKAGADAVKLQTYRADTITIDHDGPEFMLHGGLWDGRRLYELYEEAHTPWEWHRELFAKARDCSITMFSSPFDPTAVELLEKLDAPAYKIASFEIVDIPLIELCAETGKPLIISTGMATRAEIAEAVNAAMKKGKGGLALLHCTSGYPTPFAEADLRTIPDLAREFGVPVGLSDHTDGVSSAVAAIALGGSIIEKHFTLLRSDGGPDAAFSLEPAELAELTRTCRNAWDALGDVRLERAPSEAGYVKYRRSLYAVADIAEGEIFTCQNVRSIRPGLGLPPKHLKDVLGRQASSKIARGTPLTWKHLA